MMSGSPLAVVGVKELRAIAPAWLAGGLSVAAAASSHSDPLTFAALCLSAIALGAISMGHEFSHRTLSLLLSQPTPRARLLAIKFSVLAPCVVSLFAVAFATGGRSVVDDWARVIVPLACGLFIAPWLTMLGRSALAGVVFTAAIPAGFRVAREIPALSVDMVAWGVCAAGVIAAMFGWRSFMDLEVREAADGPVDFRPVVRQRRCVAAMGMEDPRWLLARKELRLQLLTFAVSGLFILGWVGIWAARGTMPYIYTSLLFSLTVINLLAIPVLAGALASAEERQLGTLEWHTLLPMSSRTQWIIKAGIAVGVSCALGLWVPMLLPHLTPSRELGDVFWTLPVGRAMLAVAFISVMSLYVSSLCASPVQSLLWSLSVVVGLATLTGAWFLPGIMRMGAEMDVNLFTPFQWLPGFAADATARLTLLITATKAAAILLYTGTLALLLWFAYVNHRWPERGLRRLCTQLVSQGAFTVLLFLLWSALFNTYIAEAEAYGRAFWRARFGHVTLSAIGPGNQPLKSYTLVVFSDDPKRYRGSMIFRVGKMGWPDGRVDKWLLPGTYAAVVVDGPQAESAARREADTLAGLRQRATEFTLAAGESRVVEIEAPE